MISIINLKRWREIKKKSIRLLNHFLKTNMNICVFIFSAHFLFTRLILFGCKNGRITRAKANRLIEK
jgi:hypothetical protein